MIKKFSLPIGFMLFLAGCASNNSQTGTPDSTNEADTIKLIEREIMEADTVRLDSLRRDSVARAEKDSVAKTLKDTLKQDITNLNK